MGSVLTSPSRGRGQLGVGSEQPPCLYPFCTSSLKGKPCVWMKLESWCTRPVRRDWNQLIFENLPFGWMLSPLDLREPQNAFPTSWKAAVLEAVGLSVGTVESDTKSSKTAQQVKTAQVEATQGKAVPWPSVLKVNGTFCSSPNCLGIRRECCLFALQVGQR